MAFADSDDPLDLLRLALGFLLVTGTLFALGLWLAGITPKALGLAGALWTLYGVLRLGVSGFLAPVAEFPAWLAGAIGGGGPAQGYSEIEALTAAGRYREAADRYRDRAASDGDVTALLRRAELQGGALQEPRNAVTELEAFRASHRLSAAEDVRLGLALVQLHESALRDPGGALRELRRLLDLHPETRHVRRIRATLAELKSELQPAAVAENQAR